MTDTETKLEEARYFFSILQNNVHKTQEFDFILNAFINSARSIPWIMRSEFNHIDGWSKWYDSYAADKDQELILKLFNLLRVESVKRRPLRTSISLSIIVPEHELDEQKRRDLENLVGKKILMTMFGEKPQDVGDAIVVQAKVDEVWRRVIGQENEGDILKLCKDYLHFLESIVHECIARFPIAVTK